MKAATSPGIVSRETVILLPSGNAFLIPAGLRVHDFNPPPGSLNKPGLVLSEFPPHLATNPEIAGSNLVYLRPDQVKRGPRYPGEQFRRRPAAVTFGKMGAALALGGLGLALWPLSSQEVIGGLLAFLGANALCMFYADPPDDRETDTPTPQPRPR